MIVANLAALEACSARLALTTRSSRPTPMPTPSSRASSRPRSRPQGRPVHDGPPARARHRVAVPRSRTSSAPTTRPLPTGTALADVGRRRLAARSLRARPAAGMRHRRLDLASARPFRPVRFPVGAALRHRVVPSCTPITISGRQDHQVPVHRSHHVERLAGRRRRRRASRTTARSRRPCIGAPFAMLPQGRSRCQRRSAPSPSRQSAASRFCVLPSHSIRASHARSTSHREVKILKRISIVSGPQRWRSASRSWAPPTRTSVRTVATSMTPIRAPVVTALTRRSRPWAGPTRSGPSTTSALLVGSAADDDRVLLRLPRRCCPWRFDERRQRCLRQRSLGIARRCTVRRQRRHHGVLTVAQSVHAYQTDSTFNAPLNGGGFDRMPDPYAWQTSASVAYKAASSAHKMDVTGPLWGAGVSPLDLRRRRRSHLHRLPRSARYVELPSPEGPGQRRHRRWLRLPATSRPRSSSRTKQGYPVPTYVANPGGGVQVGSLPNGGWLKHEAVLLRWRCTARTTPTPPARRHPAHGDARRQTKSHVDLVLRLVTQNYNQANAATGVTYNYDPVPAWSWAPPLRSAPGLPPPRGRPDHGRRHSALVVRLSEEVVQDAAWVPLENSGLRRRLVTDGYIGCLTCHRAHGSARLR